MQPNKNSIRRDFLFKLIYITICTSDEKYKSLEIRPYPLLFKREGEAVSSIRNRPDGAQTLVIG